MTHFSYNPDTIKMIRHYAQKMSAASIATVLNCPVSTIVMICKDHGIFVRDRDTPNSEAPRSDKIITRGIDIQIDEAMLRIIKKEARKRGLDTHTMMERLIEKIAADGLFGAILDR